MLVWFLALAGFGAVVDRSDARHPGGGQSAITPLQLFLHAPWIAFVSLGSVVLAVTGCEALYADMGHFGKKPIQYAWLFVALAGAAAQLFRPGRGPAARSRARRHRLLFRRAALGALSDGDAGDHGRHHRHPGRDHRRLLDHPAGGAARPIAAHGNPPHLGDRIRPDLCAAHERHAARRRGADRADLQELRARWRRPMASR